MICVPLCFFSFLREKGGDGPKEWGWCLADWGAWYIDLLLCASQTPQRRKRLFCRLHYGNRTPQLVIAPFKEEDEWDSPHIVRFYDVMSDEEIRKIKEIAKPKVSSHLVLSTFPSVPSLDLPCCRHLGTFKGKDDSRLPFFFFKDLIF